MMFPLHKAFWVDFFLLFHYFLLSFPLSSTPDLTFYELLGGCFKNSRGRLSYRCTLSMLPVFSCFMFFVVYVCFSCLVFDYSLIFNETQASILRMKFFNLSFCLVFGCYIYVHTCPRNFPDLKTIC